MTRDELMTSYDTIRASAQEIVALSGRSVGERDMKRAADQLGVLAGGKFMIAEDGPGLRMIYDTVLFERNEKGVRPFDRFLAGPARSLPKEALALASRLGQAFFSLFRFSAKHDIVGLWIEDILDNDRRIWIISINLEDHDDPHEVFGMRIMDTGEFHIVLGPIALSTDEIAIDCTTAIKALGRLPFERPLSVAIYGLILTKDLPDQQSKAKFLLSLARGFKKIDSLKQGKQAANG